MRRGRFEDGSLASLAEWLDSDSPKPKKHYGPGEHPGTGSEQEAHGGNGGGGEAAPSQPRGARLTASVPRTAKEAGTLIVRNLLTQTERSRLQQEDLKDPEQLVQIAKNWEKELKGRMNVPADFRKDVENAIAYNATSEAYQDMVDQFRGEAVILAREKEGRGTRGEFQGTTFIYYSKFDEPVPGASEAVQSYEASSRARLRDAARPPQPGTTLADSSLAGAIRHEYGHRVSHALLRLGEADRESGMKESRFEQGMRLVNTLGSDAEVTQQLSSYASKMAPREEAFAEAFAVWSHPKLDRARYSPKVNKVFDFFDTLRKKR